MSRRFVIGVDDLTPAETTVFRKYLSTRGMWWNWIPNFWLATTRTEASASDLRDHLMTLAPEKNIIVLDIDDDDWSGFGPISPEKDMFKWFETLWIKKSE